jgi:hypothetical protein
LNGTVGLDVNDISNFVLSQISRELDHSLPRALASYRRVSPVRRIVDSHLLLEVTAERIARAGSETRWMTHFDGIEKLSRVVVELSLGSVPLTISPSSSFPCWGCKAL